MHVIAYKENICDFLSRESTLIAIFFVIDIKHLNKTNETQSFNK